MKVWLSLGLLFCPLVIHASPWEEIHHPLVVPAQSIGSYANGCLVGAEPLPLQGEGYQVLRSQNGRYFSHPQTIDYLQTLAKQVRQRLGTGLLIGDLSLPQGGRFASGHASHQNGLDADIWLRLSDKPLSQEELAKPVPLSVVDVANYRLNHSNWQQKHFQMIKLAASDERVARIFVHPVIKEQLCLGAPPSDRRWLRKVRPWWGHHYHIHVRLQCPEGAEFCQPQAAPPPGDGCGMELASWRPQKHPTPKVTSSVAPKPVTKPRLPLQCQQLLEKMNLPS